MKGKGQNGRSRTAMDGRDKTTMNGTSNVWTRMYYAAPGDT
jgi:hypothetical protein